MSIIAVVVSVTTGRTMGKFIEPYLATYPNSTGHGGIPAEDPVDAARDRARALGNFFYGKFEVYMIDTQSHRQLSIANTWNGCGFETILVSTSSRERVS